MKQGNRFLALKPFALLIIPTLYYTLVSNLAAYTRAIKKFQIVHFNITPNLKVRKQNNAQIKLEWTRSLFQECYGL